MAADNAFMKFLEEKIKAYEGVMVPVKASQAERLLTKKVDINKLHPNPDDEFCMPSIGPNYGIINSYVQKFSRYNSMQVDAFNDPLMVEKVHPDGYMILNGHHRWAAALRLGFKKVPVKIVNLTQQTDIEKMLAASKHDKRVSLDLDETIFCGPNDTPEKPLPFPNNKIYKMRIRRGIPALMHYFSSNGYDLWVYSADYYSLDYIRAFFKMYSVKVDGVITGTGRKEKSYYTAKKKTDKLIAGKYNETIHIDRDLIVKTYKDLALFEEFKVDPDSPSWAKEVVRCIKEADKNAEKSIRDK